MSRPNEYCQINQGVLTTAATTVTTHQMGTTDYCAFLTQDLTVWGVLANLPYLSVADPSRTATQALVVDGSGGGFGPFGHSVDAMFVTAHSMLDVGPVMNGATPETRTINDMYRRNNVYNARPGYRSLHRKVEFLGSNEQHQIGGAHEIAVTLTHRLATTNVMVFGTPSRIPMSVGAGPFPVVKMGWRSSVVPNINAIDVYVVRDDGLAFDQGDVFWFDVMVVSAPAVGHSIVYHGNRSYTNPAFPPIAGAPWSVRPDYRAGYPNAEITGVDTIVRHNSNEEAAMLLFGYRTNSGAFGFLGVPYIVDRAPNVNESTVDTDHPLYAYPHLYVDILSVSPHSMFTSLVVSD
jgi:hypothetical protein